jgi:uncharacterized phage protein (TIGR01671 family)
MNNRPIKFRAWNKQTKQMIDLKAITPLALDPSLKMDGLFIPFFDGYIIQQFTGLKDSTGKEIYEGDIVCEKMTDEIAFTGDTLNIGRVFFAAGTFMIDGDGPLYDHTYSLTPDKLEDYLVVGNVYETPELLERNSP